MCPCFRVLCYTYNDLRLISFNRLMNKFNSIFCSRSRFCSHMSVFSSCQLQICLPSQRNLYTFEFTEVYKFVHLHRGLQICTPSQRFTKFNLYTLTEVYKFVHLHRGLQICIPSQRFTNLYTFTEDYKFVHLHRGLQICTPLALQRSTNLYTRCRGLQICIPLQRIRNVYTRIDAHSLTHSLTGVHWIPDCPGIPLQLSKTPQEAYRTQDFRQGHCKLETSEDQRPSKSAQRQIVIQNLQVLF